VRRIAEALKRIARPAAYEARLPTSIHAELAEMLGAAPAAQPVIPPGSRLGRRYWRGTGTSPT